LLSAHAGDVPRAVEHLEAALDAHIRLPMPFEQARTRLLLGQLLRRSGHRSAARGELAAANAEFVRLGTPVQVNEASAELASLGGWRTPEGELTPVEARIAALVGAGQTNREVAAHLSISVRTVESHLGRIYRKLGLRSRTELARRLHVSTAPGA
jgi:DNA-binding CsgD family transcriptional regulator